MAKLLAIKLGLWQRHLSLQEWALGRFLDLPSEKVREIERFEVSPGITNRTFKA